MSTRRRAKADIKTPTRRRPRPIPSRLLEPSDLDEMARRRCLMILSVLSGEVSVSDAIEQAQISRGFYYDLEERALEAMLVALTPGTQAATGASPTSRIEQLEQRCKKLEQDKRRSDRLLLLTRRVIKPGPVKTAAGRPRKKRTAASSTVRGSKPSPSSTKTTASVSSSPPVAEPSTPTKAGEAAP